jgi:hypothetical protein
MSEVNLLLPAKYVLELAQGALLEHDIIVADATDDFVNSLKRRRDFVAQHRQKSVFSWFLRRRWLPSDDRIQWSANHCFSDIVDSFYRCPHPEAPLPNIWRRFVSRATAGQMRRLKEKVDAFEGITTLVATLKIS